MSSWPREDCKCLWNDDGVPVLDDSDETKRHYQHAMLVGRFEEQRHILLEIATTCRHKLFRVETIAHERCQSRFVVVEVIGYPGSHFSGNIFATGTDLVGSTIASLAKQQSKSAQSIHPRSNHHSTCGISNIKRREMTAIRGGEYARWRRHRIEEASWLTNIPGVGVSAVRDVQ